MGTRGLVVLKWQNKYYIFYNHLDSYLSGLGVIIESFLREISNMSFTQLETYSKNNFKDMCPKQWTYDDTVNNFSTGLDLFIEWSYIIDLEQRNIVIHHDW